MLIIGLLIKLEDGGPIFFIQKKTGYKGEIFNLIKFRTMPDNQGKIDFSVKNKITKIGNILRKTSLDEIPQFINVLKDDMSFVGPRPWIVEKYPYYTASQMRRFDVKPGLTGLAQCCGRKSLNILERIDHDIEYVNTISFKTDVKIVVKTLLVMFGSKNDKNDIHCEFTVQDEIDCLKQNKKKELEKKAN